MAVEGGGGDGKGKEKGKRGVEEGREKEEAGGGRSGLYLEPQGRSRQCFPGGAYELIYHENILKNRQQMRI